MARQQETPGRENSRGRRTERQEGQASGTARQERRQGDFRSGNEQAMLMFSGLSRGRYFYTDISHAAYWRTLSITTALFPLVEILLLFLALEIRFLYLRNNEYREKIEAQENLVVLGTAAGTLAHEIKNPLLSIRLQTGIIEKTGGASNEITIINQEVERLSSLVYRVNDYLREPAGEQTPIDISGLAADTMRRVCGIETNPASPAIIFADEARVRSVLENILRNAMESGSPAREIGVQIVTHENTVTITVNDRGRGVDEKDINRIFDPFYTSKSTGTGIGLAVSKRFTEAAGGNISIQNRKDGGLAVILRFPLKNGEA
jgi:two-component system sensor histidine kinase HydH